MRLKTTDILGDTYVTRIAIGEFFLDEENAVGNLDDASLADLLNKLHAQIATDDLVEDGFRVAVEWDALGHGIGDDLDFDTAYELDLNFDEIMDLCDIVESVQKGFIL